jgi:hypothetical protein
MLKAEETSAQLDGLRAALAEAGRDDAGFEVSVTPRGRTDAATVAAFGALGVSRLVLMPPAGASLDEVEEFVRAHAPERIGART